MPPIHQSRLIAYHAASTTPGRSLFRALLLPFEVLHAQHWSAPWTHRHP